MSQPPTPSQELRSPDLVKGSGKAAFIYPIRSAVSVKPRQKNISSDSDSASSRRNSSVNDSDEERRNQSASSYRPQTSRTSTSGSRIQKVSRSGADVVELTQMSLHDNETEDASSDYSDSGSENDAPDDQSIGSRPSEEARRMNEGSETTRKPVITSIEMNEARRNSLASSALHLASAQAAEKEMMETMTQPRFRHVETEQGHMILTGRDGEITRCEDEPIRLPGAVQSFGCMIVVREDEEGLLVVRQVSENTTDILGLSPAHLFSLHSFLDCLDDDQADVLWDNIEGLEESEQDLTESGPHVFRLSGWGQAGPGRGKARARKNWECWCALHRVPGKKPDGEEGDNAKWHLPLTVLEFELVHDTVNPITSETPPPSPDESAGGEDADSKGLSLEGSTPAASVRTVDSDGTTKLTSAVTISTKSRGGLDGMPYIPTIEQFVESTQPSSKPLKAFQRLRRQRGEAKGKRARPRRQADTAPGFGGAPHDPSSGDNLDLFEILGQINEQLTAQSDLQGFLKVVVSLVREITGFSRVMMYQFDEQWNGQVVCELVDWNETHDLYRGLHFPATDIPKQARDLYLLNKIRLLYDRDQPSARMVCREADDLKTPVDMTHAFLRAMSPIHIKYLENMGVRASMSISIVAFDQLWGLIALHTYGSKGKRMSFPMRQLCRLIGESVSRNIERLSYTRRLSARKLINTLPTDRNPSGYIISSAEDLLTLFDADFGVIAIGNEAKILGPLNASQEVLAITEYLRIKKFQHVITSQDVGTDFPDMILPNGLQVIAGLLLVPLSNSGIDFIIFLRKGQTRHVNWAGKPFKAGQEGTAVLEPRKSFKIWSETVVGTCRSWKDEELETASVLCLVYGKFISVWRQREQAMQYNQLNKLLLSNATHEVRTPLNHIINYLEMALESNLDADTRENLSRSHMASKSLLFVINDLLDLTRHEEGNPLLLQEPFDLSATIREAVEMHEWEAKRRNVAFGLETTPSTCYVLGDAARIRQIVVNTVSNSVKHTTQGHIHIEMRQMPTEELSTDLQDNCDMEIELTISDTGSGIPREKLEAIFREFEQVESVIADPTQSRNAAGTDLDIIEQSAMSSQEGQSKEENDSGLGLGLAIVARVVKNLGGQLRVDSTVGEGSRFTYYLPFKSSTAKEVSSLKKNDKKGSRGGSEGQMKRSNSIESGGSGSSSVRSDINSLVEAISAPHLDAPSGARSAAARGNSESSNRDSNMRGANVGTITPRQKEALSSSPSKHVGRRPSVDGSIPIAGSSIPLRSVKLDSHDLDRSSRGENQRLISENLTSPRRSMEQSNMSNKANSPKLIRQRSRPSGFVRMPSQTELNEREEVSSPGSIPSSTDAEARRGSTSTVSMRKKKIVDARARSAAGSPVLGAVPDKLSRLRILVVEDDPINRMILKKRLALDGHIVMLAVNGEEGVRQYQENGHELDIILMDLQMPICNGQDACKRIRASDQEKEKDYINQQANRPASHILNGRIPIFAVSATLDFKMRQEMCDIGMDGWVLKPIDFGRLKSLMHGLTHVEHREREQWKPGHVWEKGGWLSEPANRPLEGGTLAP